MSGSGSGGYEPSVKTNFDCDTGVIITNLSSVDFQILAQHKSGDILSVEIFQNSVIVVNGNGETLGSVLHANVVELRECIELGNIYSAEIISITVTSCKVQISKS